MHFTRTPLKNKKPVKYGTNKMGKYYTNEPVPIKNYTSSPIAARIDKNMTNLNINEEAINKNLNQFIQPVFDRLVLEPETYLNIFNYNYDGIIMNTGLADKTKKYEEDYDQLKLTIYLNRDNNSFSYGYSAEIDMNVHIEVAGKIEEMKLSKYLSTDFNIFNYNYSTNVNVELIEKIQPFEEIKLPKNKDINVFNYNYSTNVNVELIEKIKTFEEMKLTTNKDFNSDINAFNYHYSTNTNMNLKIGDKHFNLLASILPETNNTHIDTNTNTNTNMNLKIGDKHFNLLASILPETNNTHIDTNTNTNMNLKIGDKHFNLFASILPEHINNHIDTHIDTKTNTNMKLKIGDKHFNLFASILPEHINNANINTNANVNANANVNTIIKNNHIDNNHINKAYTKSDIAVILKALQLKNITIENVYQEKYGPNISATGVGDFIRGSYFLMQFCKEYKLFYNINMLNHPISQFLEFYQNKQPLRYKNINKFDLTNFNPNILDDNILTNIYDSNINNDFIHYLKDQKVYNKKIYTYIIPYPTIIIDEEHKKYMRHLLKPTERLSLVIDEQLTNLGLIEKEFSIIHVRYGDNFLINKELDIKMDHLNTIEKTINNLNEKILLVSDNIIIKNILTTKYPHIKTHFNDITHTGEGIKLDTNKLKNTMIDFYLFTRAKNVFAFSVYKHGTGFSKWATETYSVPYVCRFLQ